MQDLPASTQRRRFFMLLALLIAAAAMAHAPILRFIGRSLVGDDATRQQSYSHVLPMSGDRRFDQTAQLLRENPSRRVLLLRGGPSRVEQIGGVQLTSERAIASLMHGGVDQSSVDVVNGRGRSRWDQARMLDGFLADHPDSIVLVLSAELYAQIDRVVIGSIVAKERSRRVAVRALPDRRFRASNWWKSRDGLKAVFSAYVTLLYARYVGEPKDLPKYMTPDEYEQESLRLLAE